jgi:hypothetical protein
MGGFEPREPHPFAILAGDHLELIQLDLMQPDIAGGRAQGFCGEAQREARWHEPIRQNGN